MSIDNVNLNFNPVYYVDNENPPGIMIQYDGYTTPLFAMMLVVPGQTYHIKIVIADGSDGILDSGVFLEAYSFSSLVSNPSPLRATESFCPADSTYMLVAPAGFTGYQWYDAAGDFIHANQGGTNDTLWIHNPNYGDIYRLVMIPANNVGTILYDTLISTVNSNCSSLGITNKIINETISVSPNPFTSLTTLTFNKEGKYAIKITDVLGKEIKTINFSGKEYVLEKGEMENGIYFLQIMDENKNVTNKKIVVQ